MGCVLLWESAWVALSLQCICVFGICVFVYLQVASSVYWCLSVSCCGRVHGWHCLFSVFVYLVFVYLCTCKLHRLCIGVSVCLVVGECMGGIVSSVYLCICVLAGCIVCVLVSQCVLLWESAWVA